MKEYIAIIDNGLDEVDDEFDCIDPDGVEFRNEYLPVDLKFQPDKPIGKAYPYVKDGKIYAKIKLAPIAGLLPPEQYDYKIGYQAIKTDVLKDKSGDVIRSIIRHAKIWAVGAIPKIKSER